MNCNANANFSIPNKPSYTKVSISNDKVSIVQVRIAAMLTLALLINQAYVRLSKYSKYFDFSSMYF